MREIMYIHIGSFFARRVHYSIFIGKRSMFHGTVFIKQEERSDCCSSRESMLLQVWEEDKGAFQIHDH